VCVLGTGVRLASVLNVVFGKANCWQQGWSGRLWQDSAEQAVVGWEGL
jgi:hypothetical protein